MKIAGKFEVLLPEAPRAERIRSTFRGRMEKLYSGWNDSFDRQFDHHSFLFVLYGIDGEFLATCRLTFKHRGERLYSVPAEMGDVSKFSVPSEFSRVCEGGMVSFVSKEAVLKLMYGVVSWSLENKIDRCYITYDTKNILIKRLYTQTLCFSMVEGAVVKFSEFKSKKSGLPVEWQVLEATPESGREALTKMRESGVECHYEYGKHPKLMDWTMDNRESAYEGVVSVAS